MKMGRLVSVSMAMMVAGTAFACGPKGTERRTGAAGVADASAKVFEFVCACEEGPDADVCEGGELEGYFGELPIECIDRVLADFAADRSVLACQVSAMYDALDCLQATGCPEPPQAENSHNGSEGGGQEDPDVAVDACEAHFNRAYGGECGEISDAAIERIETECDLGNEVCTSATGSGAEDCDAPPTDPGGAPDNDEPGQNAPDPD